MSNQIEIDCTYPGTTMTLGSKTLQSFDSCKLDNGWAKIGVSVNPNVRRYIALHDGAKAILRIFNTKTPATLKFRRGATVKLSTKVIQFQDKHRLKK